MIAEANVNVADEFEIGEEDIRYLMRACWKKRNTLFCYMQKCVHGIKLQSANFSNSIIANLLGSIEGRRHNVSLMGESNLLQ